MGVRHFGSAIATAAISGVVLLHSAPARSQTSPAGAWTGSPSCTQGAGAGVQTAGSEMILLGSGSGYMHLYNVPSGTGLPPEACYVITYTPGTSTITPGSWIGVRSRYSLLPFAAYVSKGGSTVTFPAPTTGTFAQCQATVLTRLKVLRVPPACGGNGSELPPIVERSRVAQARLANLLRLYKATKVLAADNDTACNYEYVKSLLINDFAGYVTSWMDKHIGFLLNGTILESAPLSIGNFLSLAKGYTPTAGKMMKLTACRMQYLRARREIVDRAINQAREVQTIKTALDAAAGPLGGGAVRLSVTSIVVTPVAKGK